MPSVGTLSLNMIMRTQAFERDMRRTRQGVSNLERGFKTFSRTLLGLAGVGGGIYGFQRAFSSVIKSASDAQETMSKFNVVFRELKGQAFQWAEDFGDSVGRATQDVAKWMAGLQDTFVPLGFARSEAFELSRNLTQLAVDVASFNNAADADVIRDFTSALVGNHETVRKYGVIISQSTMEQEALNLGWEKAYKDLTDLEKVQLRLNILFNGLTDAQGDAIRTADSYANQIKRLNAQWTETKTLLGDALLPHMTKLVELTNNLLIKVRDLGKAYSETSQNIQRMMKLEEYAGRREADIGGATPFPTITVPAPGQEHLPTVTIKHLTDEEKRIMGEIDDAYWAGRKMIEEFQKTGAGLPGTEYGMPGAAGPMRNMMSAMEDLQKKAQETARRWSEMAYSMEFSMTTAFDRMAFEGQKFSESIKNIAQDILREFMRIMFFRPAAQSMASAAAAIFNPSAAGNVFSGGRIVPMAAGGIVRQPAVFPMAGGLGLMGEAGPEAVMPLRRTASGKLGVEAATAAPNVVIQNNGPNIKQQGRPVFNGREWVVSLIVEDYERGGAISEILGR